MFATFIRATAAAFSDRGLMGFVSVEIGGQPKMYSYILPSAADPNPPGWTSIERLTKTTAEAVIQAWIGDSVNSVASDAFADLDARFKDERFLVTEVKNKNDWGEAAELALMSPHIAVPRRLETAAELAPPPVTRSFVSGITTFQLDVTAPVYLNILVGPADEPVTRVVFRVPDAKDHTPADWWFTETFTGIAHERVADAWPADPHKPNEVLKDVVELLFAALSPFSVPVRADGTVDTNLWRREVVHARFRLEHKPFLFLGRPDHDGERARALFTDVVGNFLFRADVEPGVARGVPALIAKPDGKVVLERLDDETMMRGALIRYIRFAGAGHPPTPKNPPKALVLDMIRFPDRSPPILSVVRIPTVRPDGSLITAAGYDKATNLWYAPEFELDPIPDEPTAADLREAKALLMVPFADFPFVDDGARSAAVACLLEQIVRPMIRGPRPLHVFDAPAGGAGSGKTLLAKTIQAIIHGSTTPVITALGRREEEIEKRVVTVLRQVQPVVICDNLTDSVESEALQQLATSESYQARLLHTNQAPSFPQLSTWILTLNDAKLNRDISRRVLLCRLDAKMDRPWERTRDQFRIPGHELIDWAVAHRPSLIRACLLLVRDWIVAGRPEDAEVQRGSFEGWCKVVGGICKRAGFVGLDTALAATQTRDINQEDHRQLIRIWAHKIGVGVGVPSMKVGELALEHGLYPEKFPKHKVNNMALGRYMMPILQALLKMPPIDGFELKIVSTPNSAYTLYALRTADLVHVKEPSGAAS